MDSKKKQFFCLIIPVALSLNVALVILLLKIKLEELLDGQPLPGLTELLFSIPFILWLAFGFIFSFAKLYLDRNPRKIKLRIFWWVAICGSPLIITLGLICPFSHDLSHYFTGTCNWDF